MTSKQSIKISINGRLLSYDEYDIKGDIVSFSTPLPEVFTLTATKENFNIPFINKSTKSWNNDIRMKNIEERFSKSHPNDFIEKQNVSNLFSKLINRV